MKDSGSPGGVRISPTAIASIGGELLLVEDDQALAQMYRLKLVAEGYRVCLAVDGPSGLQAAMERRPDLLLLDIGFRAAACSEVALPAHTPVLARQVSYLLR